MEADIMENKIFEIPAVSWHSKHIGAIFAMKKCTVCKNKVNVAMHNTIILSWQMKCLKSDICKKMKMIYLRKGKSERSNCKEWKVGNSIVCLTCETRWILQKHEGKTSRNAEIQRKELPMSEKKKTSRKPAVQKAFSMFRHTHTLYNTW